MTIFLSPMAVALPITPLGNLFMTPSHVELLFSPTSSPYHDERFRVEGLFLTAAVSLCATSSPWAFVELLLKSPSLA